MKVVLCNRTTLGASYKETTYPRKRFHAARAERDLQGEVTLPGMVSLIESNVLIDTDDSDREDTQWR